MHKLVDVLNINPSTAYIDVRGPWPLLIDGLITLSLEGFPRGITVPDAIERLTTEILTAASL